MVFPYPAGDLPANPPLLCAQMAKGENFRSRPLALKKWWSANQTVGSSKANAKYAYQRFPMCASVLPRPAGRQIAALL
jgi:hypothetical protein